MQLFSNKTLETSLITEYGCQMIKLIQQVKSNDTPIAHEKYDCLLDLTGALQS